MEKREKIVEIAKDSNTPDEQYEKENTVESSQAGSTILAAVLPTASLCDTKELAD